MKLLVVVLNERENLDDLMEALLALEVNGLTSVESEEVVSLLAQEVPIFAGLRHMLTGPREHNMTVFGLSDKDDVLVRLAESLKEVGVDMNASGFGYAFCVPVEGAAGGALED
ncbi:MAG: hypothetical protein JW909_00525 [Planctomycetes bacterium]|nr:hypothetical protein [Planctomycetota bacterium]